MAASGLPWLVSSFRFRARLGFSIPSLLSGQRGVTPAFEYAAPHPSVGGTLTLMSNALLSTHYRRTLTTTGRYVMSGGSNRQLRDALFLGPLLSIGGQKLGNLLARPNQSDLLVLKNLVEARKVRPVIERFYQLSDVPEAVRYLETGHA